MAISFNKKIRRNQLIFTFGIGQMIDFPDKSSLMLAGIDAWDKMFDYHSDYNQSFDDKEFKIRDKRLEKKLDVDYFIMPPEFRKRSKYEGDNVPNQGIQLPYVRFPLWHYCTSCSFMEKLSLHYSDIPYCDQDCKKKKKKSILVPIRFVVSAITVI